MTIPATAIEHHERSGPRIDWNTWTQRLIVVAIAASMSLFIAAPLGVMLTRSFTDDSGRFAGLHNFATYVADPALRQSTFNTLWIGAVTMAVTVCLAFPIAYAVSCTRMPFKKCILVLCMLPLYAPTMLYGIGLYSLFGNQGLFTTGLFGRVPLQVSFDIHGLSGIIVAEILASLPPAVLILSVVMAHRDRRLYEAAESMGATPARIFWSITLPSCRAGLISAAAIAFVLSTTDYGAPEMLAEKTNVLALDIAVKAMGIGQPSDHAMGAVISLVLLVPTAIASVVQMFTRKRQTAALTARFVPMQPTRQVTRDSFLFLYCLLITAVILLVTAGPVLISFTRSWPYSLYPITGVSNYHGTSLTLANFNFTDIGQSTGGGISAYTTSLFVAILTAIMGTVFSFVCAYVVARTSVLHALRHVAGMLAMVPLGLPGMVIGLSYILIFNPIHWGPFPNPTAGLYNTLALLVICNVVHYLGVSYLTAAAAIEQLDGEFEQVASSLAVPLWVLFLRVTLPICLPALIEIALYYFVSAMTTVSAVIFLVSVKTPLASVAIINLKDSGNLEAAAAMAVLILCSNVIVRAMAQPLIRLVRSRSQRWRFAN